MRKVEQREENFYSEFGKDDAFKLFCLTSLDIHLQSNRTEPDIVLGHLVFVWRLMEEALDRQFLSHSQDRIIRAGHPDIGDEGGSLWQDSSISRRRVSMSSNDRTHPPIQVPCERHFLRGSLCMHIDEDDFCLLPDFAHRPIGGLEGAVDWLHVCAALQVEDADLPFSTEVVNDVAVAAVLPRIVERAEDTLLF